MLNDELRNLFVDSNLNHDMMNGECEIGSWTMGYGEDLTRMGVEWEEVDSYGGEDCGSNYYHVWKFTRDDEFCYFKFDGWYASHYGADFQSVFEVTPQQKTVTEYV